VSKHFRQGLKVSKSSYSFGKLREKQFSTSTFISAEQIIELTCQQQQQQQKSPSHLKRLNLTPKKLHLYVITRLDLSDNQLTQIPFTVFQIESLKLLKLSSNRLTELPTAANALDDKHRPKTTQQQAAAWACHNLEEAYFDHNQLLSLPFQLFQLRSLKHLNVSNNQLQAVPEQLWSAPQLLELNAAFNRLQVLPLVSKQAFSVDLTLRKADPTTHTPAQPAVPASVERQQVIVEQTSKLSRQLQISYEEKPVAKANFWRPYSVLDANATNFDDEEPDLKQPVKDFKLKQHSYSTSPDETVCITGLRECPLKELNLANNLFERVPECLSCLAPRLVKLNLSFNRLESMGAVCDLPRSLKFLDLSHNSIKFSMRLLNEKLLLLLIAYLEGFCTDTCLNTDYQHLLDNFSAQTHLLLDNDFCYQGLVSSLKDTIQNSVRQQRQRASSPGPQRG